MSTVVLMKALVLVLVFQTNQQISVENRKFHGEKKLRFFEILSKLHCLKELFELEFDLDQTSIEQVEHRSSSTRCDL